MEYSNHFLGYLELGEDLFFDKVPKDEISKYVERALSVGKETAAQLEIASITQHLEQAGIACEVKEDDGAFFRVKFRAQFEYDRRKAQHKIILYKKSLEELAQANQLSYEQVKEIVLTHEFYHYLELKGTETISTFEPVTTFNWLGLTRTAQLVRLSEIAANAFTKALLKLDNLPNVLDYRYMLKGGLISKQMLESKYEEFEQVFGLKSS
ncbi:hypothetical protein SAMN04488134_102268 [Amphibacillus marinus]|uniref:Uncharacterized protein n=1 Tax=Amphibacillus marinus TaxID=872970 RepID=A0A1H8KF35_9BACI|nr:hypothetical protein [Amphibacillus marinus]SEN91455.1 hypothetical protein SAMN04488134_102268 [Amphibacillus marinus]